MNPNDIRQTKMYAKALESAASGDSVSMTLASLLEDGEIKTEINKSKGDLLIVVAFVVRQAHADVQPIQFDYPTFSTL